MDDIEAYCNLDASDTSRIALAKKIKTEGLAWVSKYARGGSARTLSARKWVGWREEKSMVDDTCSSLLVVPHFSHWM